MEGTGSNPPEETPAERLESNAEAESSTEREAAKLDELRDAVERQRDEVRRADQG
jgi:hypothetical protein